MIYSEVIKGKGAVSVHKYCFVAFPHLFTITFLARGLLTRDAILILSVSISVNTTL